MDLLRARKSKLHLDLTPLIDVVFQLLVFFMLTSVFVHPSMKMVLPRASNEETEPGQRVMIRMGSDGQVMVNDRVVAMEHLSRELALLLQTDPWPVHLHGDKEMPYQYFVQVMGMARRAGAQQIHIVHQP